MSQQLGQDVIVQNVGGAGGSLAAGQVAQAEPDGYTILMGTVATHALNPLILKQKPYDPVTDFAPVSLLVLVPNVLAVNPEVPADTVQELIDLAKAEPLAYASSGNGTPLHLSGDFQSMFRRYTHIPDRVGPALTDCSATSILFETCPRPRAITSATQGAVRHTAERVPLPRRSVYRRTLPGYETYAGTPSSRRQAPPERSIAERRRHARWPSRLGSDAESPPRSLPRPPDLGTRVAYMPRGNRWSATQRHYVLRLPEGRTGREQPAKTPDKTGI